MTLLQSSKFYLERVGFEVNINFRHNLKLGKNLVGRIDKDDTLIDIPVNSTSCARRHCLIQVNDDTVFIENLNVT